jgi:methyl-accepting chemotaxis protein WspA
MKFTIGKRIAMGYLLAAIALVVIGWIAHTSTGQFIQANERTTHTYKVLLELDDILADIKDAEMSVRGYVVGGDGRFLERYHQATNTYRKQIQDVKSLTEDPTQLGRLAVLSQHAEDKFDVLKKIIQSRDVPNPDMAMIASNIYSSKLQLDVIRTNVADIMTSEEKLLDERSKFSADTARNTEWTIILGTLLTCVLLLIIGLSASRSISLPLGRVTAVANSIAAGELSADLKLTQRNDEVGDLTNAFVRMAENLRQIAEATKQIAAGNLTVNLRPQSERDVMGNAVADMTKRLSELIGQVQRSGIQVNTSVAEIAATARQQQATATEIAGTTTEIGATSRQISATSQELVRTMGDVAEVAVETTELAGAGRQSLNRMEGTMHQLVEAAGAINSRLAVLNEKAGNINQVVTTINKVADQTNLLSLNAAIEAEKAGEYGRGFAVVATEIRRLADQTAVATYDIEQTVKEMQTAVSAGVMSMDKFSDEVRRAVEEVRRVGEQLSRIIEQVQALTPRFDAVNDGMQTQSSGAQQISEALGQLSESAQQTAESLRQSTSAIDQLNDAAAGLRTSVTRFKVQT